MSSVFERGGGSLIELAPLARTPSASAGEGKPVSNEQKSFVGPVEERERLRQRRHGQGGVLHYSLGPALYPDDYPVDYHFCAYCADDNLEL